jgi:hypothetical protein
MATVSDRLFCAKPNCRAFGRHLPDCAGEDCRGCQPRPAADGVLLCQVDQERIGTDATTIADIYDELAYSVMPSGNGQGQPIGRSSDGPPAPRDKVVNIRTEIRHVLASWCRLVGEERGHQLPADEVSAMGAYVAKHATWLAAHGAAGEVAEELSSLRRRAWSVAYPNGTRVMEIGPCPQVVVMQHDCEGQPVPPHHPACVRAEPCPGTLRAIMRPRDEGLLPSEVVCDTDPQHRWSSSEWRQLDRLVSGRRAA